MKVLMIVAAWATSAVLVLPTVTQAESGSMRHQIAAAAQDAAPKWHVA